MGLLRYIEDNQWERVGLSKIACAGEGGRERKWGASCVVWGLVAREGRQCGGALVKTSEANKTGRSPAWACGVEDREWRVRAEKGTEEARTTSVVTA